MLCHILCSVMFDDVVLCSVMFLMISLDASVQEGFFTTQGVFLRYKVLGSSGYAVVNAELHVLL